MSIPLCLVMFRSAAWPVCSGTTLTFRLSWRTARTVIPSNPSPKSRADLEASGPWRWVTRHATLPSSRSAACRRTALKWTWTSPGTRTGTTRPRWGSHGHRCLRLHWLFTHLFVFELLHSLLLRGEVKVDPAQMISYVLFSAQMAPKNLCFFGDIVSGCLFY